MLNAMSATVKKDPENLKDLSLPVLKEMLERLENLLKSKSLLSKLPDQGGSILKHREALLKEIQDRETMGRLTEGLDSLSVTPKYVLQLCSKEHLEEEQKFKPFSTLNHRESSAVLKHKDRSDVSAALEPEYKLANTKPVALAESLQLQVEQVNRIKEEKQEHLTLLASQMIEGAEKCKIHHVEEEEAELLDLELEENE